jgi:hypothetical protein
MGKYEDAGKYADLALQEYGTLMDYNNTNSPIPRFNTEVIFHHFDATPSLLSNTRGKIDSNLFKTYDINDLRKKVFFNTPTDNSPGFRGSYDGNGIYGAYGVFDGLSTNELYLIRAECYARANDANAAIADLNKLMEKRWDKNSWTPFTSSDPQDALNKVLVERRKELIYRGLRWSDIRRFNVEGANITLYRNVAGANLPPNDLRTVMLIPQEEINLSGIPQNPRQP